MKENSEQNFTNTYIGFDIRRLTRKRAGESLNSIHLERTKVIAKMCHLLWLFTVAIYHNLDHSRLSSLSHCGLILA